MGANDGLSADSYPDDFYGQWTMFDKTTGQAMYVITCPWATAVSTAVAAGLGAAFGAADPDRHLVIDGQFVERARMPIVVEGLRLSSVPFPACLTIEGQGMPDIEGPTVEFDFLPGDSYAVEIRRDPYLPWRHTFSL